MLAAGLRLHGVRVLILEETEPASMARTVVPRVRRIELPAMRGLLDRFLRNEGGVRQAVGRTGSTT